jgi:hypothetical protein
MLRQRAKAQIGELVKVKDKARARTDGVSLLALKEKDEPAALTERKSMFGYDFTTALTVFVAATAVSMGAFIAVERMRD